MKKSVLMFSLLSGTALMLPDLAVASGIFSTHKSTPQPEPASSLIDMSRSYKTAGICFLGVGDCDPNVGFGKGDDYKIDTEAQCKNEGFSKQNCNSVQTIDGICPYNATYGKGCKCVSNLISCPAGQVGVGDSCGGKYASCKCDPALINCASNQVGQGASCGGKYQSCVCKSEYQYNSSNCTSPRSVSGASCGGKYTGCSCPSGVSSGSYGCETYYPSPCSSVCKKAYADNCRNRTAVSTPYGCAEYWADCSSKCKTKYNDNCRNRTAVISSCPANATCSYFSDCSSKIQSWSCNSGYTQEGSSCIADNPCPGYEQKSSCPNKYYNKEVCSKDSSYIKCTPTCGSRIVDDNPSYKIDEGNSGGVVVVTKSGSYLPYGSTVYSNVNFPQYSECAALSKPTITLTASNGYAASISTNRIENIDFVVNFKAWTQPDYCSAASQYRYSSFCTSSCSSYDCYCRSSCMSNSSCRDYSIECMNYYDAMVNGSSHMDLCEVANNYDSYCTNTNSPSVGVKLDPNKQIRTETYTNNGKSSTRYYYEGTLKNVNITVNGSPQIAAQIGGGAHYDKTIKFEGTNSISGGSKHSVWARGHNTYAYGIVRGVLQVNSGAKLTLSKPACIYTQWNGSIVKSGTVSGTVTTNCSTYPLKW